MLSSDECKQLSFFLAHLHWSQQSLSISPLRVLLLRKYTFSDDYSERAAEARHWHGLRNNWIFIIFIQSICVRASPDNKQASKPPSQSASARCNFLISLTSLAREFRWKLQAVAVQHPSIEWALVDGCSYRVDIGSSSFNAESDCLFTLHTRDSFSPWYWMGLFISLFVDDKRCALVYLHFPKQSSLEAPLCLSRLNALESQYLCKKFKVSKKG